MSRQLLTIIQRKTIVDPNTGDEVRHASLSLTDKQGTDFGVPRYFTGYDEVGARLQAEAEVSYEELNDKRPLYDEGKPVRIWITVEDEDIVHLGFNPNADKQEAAPPSTFPCLDYSRRPPS